MALPCALTTVRDPQLLCHYTRSVAATWIAAGLDPDRIVPVGRDQIQHVEIAADIAGSCNHVYGDSFKFKIHQAVIPDAGTGRTLPGVDGRKMSKSYDNTIPLFCNRHRLTAPAGRLQMKSPPQRGPS